MRIVAASVLLLLSAVGARAEPPREASWVAIPMEGSPSARLGAACVWTGRELLVWGGYTDEGDHYAPVGTGARYDPASHRWRALPLPGSPGARAWHSAVWTGREMIVWGGSRGDELLGDGAAYDPATDRWRAIAEDGAPLPRVEHSTVWTGREMLVIAGVQEERSFTGGGRYDPAADRWRPLAGAGFLRGSRAQGAVWTGREVIVFGGVNGGSALRQGGGYDPSTDTWRPISLDGAPTKRGYPGVAWTGRQVVVYGGSLGAFDGPPAPGGALYDPEADRWTPLPTPGAPRDRLGHAMVWSGEELLVWGGGACHGAADVHDPVFDDGAVWRPGVDAWTPLVAEQPPAARAHAAALWTGDALLVWGGVSERVHRDGGILHLR